MTYRFAIRPAAGGALALCCAVLATACGTSSDAAGGGIPVVEYSVWRKPGLGAPAVIAPDGSVHVFVRSFESAAQAIIGYNGGTATGTTTEYGEELFLPAGDTVWQHRDIYQLTRTNGQASQEPGVACLFVAGGRVWLTAGSSGAYGLSGGAWQPEPALATTSCEHATTDVHGTAHLLYVGRDGSSPVLTRFDGMTATPITVENQSLTDTRPVGPTALATRGDGSTDVVWIGIDEYNIEDPLWEEVLHHLRIGPDGAITSPSAAAPPVLNLVTAWWRPGGHVRPRFTDLDLSWHAGVLHLFVTASELGEATGTPDDGSHPLSYGVMHAMFDGTAWTEPALVAAAGSPLAVQVWDHTAGDAAVAIVETRPDPEAAVAPSRWQVAPFTAAGLGDWANPTGLSQRAQQAELPAAAVVRRGSAEVAAVSLTSAAVYGHVVDRGDEVQPPAIVRALATTPTTVVVTLDRVLDPQGTDLSGITVDGVSVTARELPQRSSRVLLRTAPQAPGASLTVRAAGLIPGGTPEAVVTGYVAAPMTFLNTSSPFTDAPFVVFDRNDRLISGTQQGDALVILGDDRVSFGAVPAPPTAVDKAWSVTWKDEVWLSSERRLLQWNGDAWAVHDAEEQADPYSLVHQLASTPDAVWALFWSQTSTRLVRFDGLAWTALPDAPSPLHAFAATDGGAVLAAGGSCCSYARFNNQLHRYEGGAWTTETLDPGATGATVESVDDMAVAPDGAVLFVGTARSPNGTLVSSVGIRRDGVVTWSEPPGTSAFAWRARLVPQGDQPPLLVGGSVSVYKGGAFVAVEGIDRASSAALDRYGFLWTTTGSGGGYTGLNGLRFHGPVGL